MERSLFSFIWKYSRREQLVLLGFTLFTFPFLYATLDLPKRIINDAIGADTDRLNVFGFEMTQVQFLFLLCIAYLGAVLVHGLLKMRLNTMKGVLAERLLRRFRYTLIARMMRFPRRYYENTSQGELVSMVTSEAEPMGGLMGDAVAQPVFQAGQMLIIVVFLFLQSPWFGLAGIALIPLQAWIIPMLQRQINQLNKERIKEVRQLAAEIGETAAGVTDLRVSGGWRFRLARFTDRLGRLFDIRFLIYQKKFFMKFLNNFITQLTPFFFYSVGGYLAIKGEISIGALVAALAAYKDLSSPWKELLTYYNQVQDMSLRWDIVTERFAPRDTLDVSLFEDPPAEIPHLRGDIEFQNVTLRSGDGHTILDGLDFTFPKGSKVAVSMKNQSERRGFAELLAREVLPTRGKIKIAGHDLSGLHQSVVAARIGYVPARPYIFQGNVGNNLLMSLRTNPKTVLWDPKSKDRQEREARKSGNSLDSLKADWLDPGLAELTTEQDVYDWWFELAETIGASKFLFRGMLTGMMDPEKHPILAKRIVKLRGEVKKRLSEAELLDAVNRFDPDHFNPSVPLGANLMFAAPREFISLVDLSREKAFLHMITQEGLAEQCIAISQILIETLHDTFGRDGTGHPLFTALGIEEALYEQLVDIAKRRRTSGDGDITDEEFALVLTVPFAFTAEQIGPGFPESFKEEIVDIRKRKGAALRERVKDLFVPIAEDVYLPRLTVLENLIYGRVNALAGLRAKMIEDALTTLLGEHDLIRPITVNVMDVPTSIGGSNLPTAFHDRVAFNRAAIKRPDVLVLNQALSSRDATELARIRNRLGDLLPETTQFYIDDSFADANEFDIHLEINNGKVDGVERLDETSEEDGSATDLRRKLREISRNDLFSKLDARNQRLLAFAAQWYRVEAGQRVFRKGELADSVYLCIEGYGQLAWFDPDGTAHGITEVTPGRVIGDLAVIMSEPRQLDFTAHESSLFLRIGADQFRSVVENDQQILLSLLRTIAGHLAGAADALINARVEIQDGGSSHVSPASEPVIDPESDSKP